MMPVANNNSFSPSDPDLQGNNGVIWGTGEEQISTLDTDKDVSSLGKDEFMKLLLAQLKHQDPLNPADNTEFVAQLAQFSSLEQMTQMNTNLEKTLNNNLLISEAVNNAMLVNYFGKSVRAESGSFMYDGQNSVKLQFQLNADTIRGSLEITNKDGSPVRTLPLGELSAGLNTVEWDSITDYGVEVNPGEYSFNIKAYDLLDNEVETLSMINGVVDGVSYQDGNAHLSVGGLLVPFDKVMQIYEDE
ncbi:MAG: hypothetical protein HOC71_05865 [Candidatus Latescibacteria bacterium]|jgi:flagellar basal-body rod modification protein FlgD|nr:hypothetical protein [Candidatus Latescibacterota bacterium]